jgi:hypothetical protein
MKKSHDNDAGNVIIYHGWKARSKAKSPYELAVTYPSDELFGLI